MVSSNNILVYKTLFYNVHRGRESFLGAPTPLAHEQTKHEPDPKLTTSAFQPRVCQVQEHERMRSRNQRTGLFPR